jgi:uncharacterized protein (TIGR00369 family)
MVVSPQFKGNVNMTSTRAISTARASGFPIEVPFLEHLGVKMIEYSDTRATVQLALEPCLLNSWQVAHGGVVMTLLDVAMAMAGRPLNADDHNAAGSVQALPVGNVTVEMKTSFMAPATGLLTARGLCIKRTATLSFCEAELFDGKDLLVAKASGTFKFWRAKK